MVRYLQDIHPLESIGMTDEQIAATLATIRQRPVQLNELESRLTLWGILGRDPRTNERTGPLVESAISGGAIAPVCQQLLSWLGSNRSQQLSTDRPDVAPLWAQGMQLLVGARVIDARQAAQLHALAGELVHPGLTAADVTQARTSHEAAEAARLAAEAEEAERQQVRDAIRQETDAVINAINAGDKTAAADRLRTLADQIQGA